jgi:hypothetical protein
MQVIQSCEMQFPTVICPNVHSFAVLRDICTISLTKGGNPKFKRVRLDLDFDASLGANWSLGKCSEMVDRPSMSGNIHNDGVDAYFLYRLVFTREGRYIHFLPLTERTYRY